MVDREELLILIGVYIVEEVIQSLCGSVVWIRRSQVNSPGSNLAFVFFLVIYFKILNGKYIPVMKFTLLIFHACFAVFIMFNFSSLSSVDSKS